MTSTLARTRSFSRPIRLLMVNQLTINAGFYMLMPYLANHLSGDLHLAAWVVGLILGVRNLSQQGLFLLGGSLADRLGYKPLILAGLVLRTVGFALLGFGTDLPTLIVASALTGLAGALFNPAVRAYLAREAGDQRVEVFAVFNVYYQLGILVGPLLGLALGGIAFQVTCEAAAALFAVLAVVQARALPACGGEGGAEPRQSLLREWRQAWENRAFLLFSLAMTGSYILNFQIYLALPVEAQRVTGGRYGVMLLFGLSGLMAVTGQIRVTTWARARWEPPQAIVAGLSLMATAFVPLVAVAGAGPGLLSYAAVLLTTALLTLATMIVYPFEMSTIVTLGGERMVGTYYGLYNTLSGVGVAIGTLGSGAALDAGRGIGLPALPWLALTAVGAACAAAVYGLHRTGRLSPGATPLPRPGCQAPGGG